MPKNKKFWKFKNQAEENEASLFLNGEISEETWYGDEVTPQLFKDDLAKCSGNISVWINSPGGDVFAAAQIYNALKDYKGKVTVKIDSLAASAASFIAMAGDEVQISPVGMLMIHNPWTMAAGDRNDLQKAIDILDEVREATINAYEAKTGLRRSKITQLIEDETWMNAKKAVELGFADKIMFSDKDDDEDEDEKKKNPFEPEPKEPDNPDDPDKEDEDDDEDDEDEKKKLDNMTSMLFTRKTAYNSFFAKVKEESKRKKNPRPTGTKASELRRRLYDLI